MGLKYSEGGKQRARQDLAIIKQLSAEMQRERKVHEKKALEWVLGDREALTAVAISGRTKVKWFQAENQANNEKLKKIAFPRRLSGNSYEFQRNDGASTGA